MKIKDQRKNEKIASPALRDSNDSGINIDPLLRVPVLLRREARGGSERVEEVEKLKKVEGR